MKRLLNYTNFTGCLIPLLCLISLGAVLLPAPAVASSSSPKQGESCSHGFCSGEREEWAVSVTNRAPDQGDSVLRRDYPRLPSYTGRRGSPNAVLVCMS